MPMHCQVLRQRPTCQFVAFALKPLNSFSAAFQTSTSKVGTLQQDTVALPCVFLSNFIKPEILSSTQNADLHKLDFADSATQLTMLENADDAEGTLVEERVP